MGSSVLGYLFENIRVRWIFMAHIYDAYFDESGTDEKSPFICVGGFLFSKSEVKNFDEGWYRNVNPKLPNDARIFHAVDCFHGRKEFAGLLRGQREGIFSSIIRLINKTARLGVVVGVERDIYNKGISSNIKLKSYTGQPSTICSIRCAEYVGDFLSQNQRRGDVLYVFEESQYTGEVRKFLSDIEKNPELRKRLHIWDHATMQKRHAIPLQAADLLVWEWYRAHLTATREEHKNRRWRNTLSRLVGPKLKVEFLTVEGIGALIMKHAFYGLKSNRTYRES